MISRNTAFHLFNCIARQDYPRGMHWFEVASRPWWRRVFPSTYAYRPKQAVIQ